MKACTSWSVAVGAALLRVIHPAFLLAFERPFLFIVLYGDGLPILLCIVLYVFQLLKLCRIGKEGALHCVV
jgi:hypothetical protein